MYFLRNEVENELPSNFAWYPDKFLVANRAPCEIYSMLPSSCLLLMQISSGCHQVEPGVLYFCWIALELQLSTRIEEIFVTVQ